ncbi:response regulator [Desulfatibacillum aliphaticivorans]|uniref:Protein with response regulator receiver domain n=1 Tax=Desulfatibacillum aliphaticivorans TaxID=218208 RepID=B8FAK9_DESAL|nr:response regulator [Desulfatibacillum aliphaticivorans]ACL03305.1 Protein with response regulator receiver domain [Desulfatibacillum aliphaticivorans]
MEEIQHTVLCVDDEVNILHSLKRLLRREPYNVLTATSGDEALNILEKNEVQLIVCDQRMPGMSGTELMSRVRDLYPETIRIVLSGYSEIKTITEAINKGHIYKFFFKPWDDENLKLEIRAALQHWELIRANKVLHEQVIGHNQELSQINERLEQLVWERTQELEFRNQALEVSHAILADIPLPIIGMDPDGCVVLINRKAEDLREDGIELHVDNPMRGVLPSQAAMLLNQAILENSAQSMQGVKIGAKTYDMKIVPLSGQFSNRGFIITLLD